MTSKEQLENNLKSAKENLAFHRQKHIQELAIVTQRDKLIVSAIEGVTKAEMALAAAIPVNVEDRTLTDGSPVTEDHRELRPDGMQKGYVVLSEAERAKGFVRPVRRTYVHDKCGVATTMGQALAETYARKPDFYSGTFCIGCGAHFPVGSDGEFKWDDGTRVGA